MDRGYQPIQAWAIIVERGRAKPAINVCEPAGPKYALVEGPVDGPAAVDMHERIGVTARQPRQFPKRPRKKQRRQCDEEDNPQGSLHTQQHF